MKNSYSSRTVTGRQSAVYYVDGSTARQLAPSERRYAQSGRQPVRGRTPSRRHMVKAAPMNMGYIMVLIAALLAVCAVLMFYIKLQSDITNHINNISTLESELNSLKLENDETYTKIMSSVDLEEIKRIAVNELGMKYAKEGQVVQYTGEGNDYVRQYSDIPQQ